MKESLKCGGGIFVLAASLLWTVCGAAADASALSNNCLADFDSRVGSASCSDAISDFESRFGCWQLSENAINLKSTPSKGLLITIR